MHVCFLTHYFPPEVGAPQTRIALLAQALAQAGAEVTVHTGFPHYPDGGVKPPYRNRPWLRERDGPVTIIRSAVYPAANRGFAPRLLDHTAFALSALYSAPLAGPADAVVAESPPLFTAASGAAYAAGKRAALIVNVADRWPASAVELGALSSPAAIRAAEALERWIYRRADLLTCPTEGIAAALESLPDAAGKARRVWPVIDTDRFATPPGDGHGGPLRVLYAGTLGLAHGLETLVEASLRAGPEVVRTSIAGDGAEAEHLRSLIRERRVANVELLGTVAPDRIPGLYADAGASAVLLRDVEIFRGALPTKMLEAMAAGRPVVVAARGEAAELIRSTGAGLAVAPEDPVALADAFRRLHDDPQLADQLGRAGRRWAAENLGKGRAAEQWQAALEAAAARRAARKRRPSDQPPRTGRPGPSIIRPVSGRRARARWWRRRSVGP